MREQPTTLQLLQTVAAVAANKNSTLALPFPLELLRFPVKAQEHPPEGRPPLGPGM
ncbi:hypothetical protein ACWD5F_00005 [Streptomyces sp. NPDC002499]